MGSNFLRRTSLSVLSILYFKAMKKLNHLNHLLVLAIILLASCSVPDNIKPNQGTIVTPTEELAGIIQDDFEGELAVIYGNSSLGVLVAYSRTSVSGKTLDFQLSEQSFPNVFEDSEGTVWNIFGEAVSGPGIGDKLKPISYQVGYWFSFATFYPIVSLYGEAESERIKSDFSSSEWGIDPAEMKQAALKDAIPSIDRPQFVLIDPSDQKNDNFDNEELMIVLQNNSAIKVYPHRILDWHEIINDTYEGENIVLSYCPLTGTGSIWESNATGSQDPDFGVSGLLYNNNLILYDRGTESLWSQILGKSINGAQNTKLVTYKNSITMNWRGIKALGSQTNLLTGKTGVNRSYNTYPYGNYKTNSELLFTVTYPDFRIHRKERVLALIINDKTKVYRFKDFSNQ
jgi:Protein of unknown function (DUF3179)